MTNFSEKAKLIENNFLKTGELNLQNNENKDSYPEMNTKSLPNQPTRNRM